MVYVVSPAQQQAFLGSHEMSTRVTVFRGSQDLGDIPVSAVSVYATYGTRGGRDGGIVVDRNVIASGLLNPLSDQVAIRTGIKGVVEVPIFMGRVDSRAGNDDGSVEVTLLSRGAEAIRAAFEVPWGVSTPFIATQEMTDILHDVDPSWGVDTSDATAQPIPGNMVFEEDRGGALDFMAQGSSLIWQPDRSGGFRIFDNPYAIGPTVPSVITLRDGVGGCVVQVRDTTSREGVYNSVTVVTERVDNSLPLRATVRDNVVGSPTLWGGLFGKQNLVIKNQSPVNISQVQTMARRILRQSLALQRSWRITLPHMPLLDPGDVFTLVYQGEVTAQVVESVRYSGAAQDLTALTSRELAFRDIELL